MAGFIEQLGGIASKVLTDTLEDPKKREKLLRMGLESLTMPDRTDTSNAAYNLGRFRAISAKQQQEAQARAKALEKEEEYQKEMRGYKFELRKGMIDKKFQANMKIAELAAEEKNQTADQRKAAREAYSTYMGGQDHDLSFFVDTDAFHGPRKENGERNILFTPFFAELLSRGKIEIPSARAMEKVLIALDERYKANIRKLNASSAVDMKDKISYGGDLLNKVNGELGFPVLSKHKDNFPKLNVSDLKDVNAVQIKMEVAGNSWLNNFNKAIPQFMNTASLEAGRKIFGTTEEFRKARVAYRNAMAIIAEQGLDAPNAPFVRFIKNYLDPLMVRTGADKFFEYAFNAKKRGQTIEGGEESLGMAKGKSVTTRLTFLRDEPLMAKLAIHKNLITNAEYIHALRTMPNLPGKISQTTREEQTPDGQTHKVQVLHNSNFYPLEVVQELHRNSINISKIKNKEDRNELTQLLSVGKQNYSNMSDKERQAYHDKIHELMRKNETDYSVDNKSINTYYQYALDSISAQGTQSIIFNKNGSVTRVNLQDTSVGPYKVNSDGSRSNEKTKTQQQVERVARQRQNIDFKLLGMVELLGMSYEDSQFFGGINTIAQLDAKVRTGSAAEFMLNLDNILGSTKELFSAFGQRFNFGGPQNYAQLQKAYLDSQTPAALKDFQDRHGFRPQLRGYNNAERIQNLARLAGEQQNMLEKRFQQQYNDARTFDAKKRAYIEHLRRAALLWEKTSLTYQMAGYVQGDQTGGRTISNQDFDNVYRALWGGSFYTSGNAQNAVRYLLFQNNEAMNRGKADALLMQATGQSFLNARHSDMAAHLYKRNLKRFYSKAGNEGIQDYVEGVGIGRHSPSVDEAKVTVNQLLSLRATLANQGMTIIEGIPTLVNFPTQRMPEEMKQYREHLTTSFDLVSRLNSFRAGLENKGTSYEPTEGEISTYTQLREHIYKETPLGKFLGDIMETSANMDKVTEELNFPVGFPSSLRHIANIVTLIVETGDQFDKAETQEVEGYKIPSAMFGFTMLETIRRQREKREGSL